MSLWWDMLVGEEMGTDFETLMRKEIRAQMTRKNLSQRTLAAAWNISPANVPRALSGNFNITLKKLQKTAEVFDMSVWDLVEKARENL